VIHPKIRVYLRSRSLGVMRWQYVAGTHEYATKAEALAQYARISGLSITRLRAEFGATHGYYIED
jgi:hypothetical protein